MLETTIVGFGDSLTFGYGVDRETSHMYRLASELPKRYPSITWKVINSGENGATSREGLSHIRGHVLRYDPNIVLILFGSNDSALDEYQYRTSFEFKNNLDRIATSVEELKLQSSQNSGKAIPVLITPPPVVDVRFMPYTTNERVRKYVRIVEEVAETHACPLLDFYSYVYEKSRGSFKNLFQYDGVHLSPLGYDLLFQCVFEGISALLDKNGVIIDR